MIRKFEWLDLVRLAQLSSHAQQFLSALLCPDSSVRLQAAECASHIWFETVSTNAPIREFGEKAALLKRQLAAQKKFRVGVQAVMAANKLLTPLFPPGPQKVAVVTGGRSGIGGALVERLVATEEFRHVVYSSREEHEIVCIGAECIIVKDFEVAESVTDFAEEIIRRFGRVDVLFNNAGVFMNQQGSFLSTTAEEMARSFAVNTIAPMLLMQRFIPLMEEQEMGGWIVNVSSSLGAMYGMADKNLSYRISKVALNCLTLVASAEHSAGWIRVNSVCPGFVDTQMTKALRGTIPMDSPAEAVDQIVWLLSDDAPTGGFYQRGQIIYW